MDVADLDETAQVAASRMNTRNVGTLVVIDAAKSPVGIVTDRDLAIRVVGKGLDPNATTLQSVMSGLPDSVTENTPIESAIAAMQAPWPAPATSGSGRAEPADWNSQFG